jgi:hypothetical protein
MLTKAEFLASLQREHDITLHLVSKLTPVLAEFRLSPGQRSTLELLRYLTVQIEGTLSFFLTASWDGWETAEEAAKSLTLEQIPDALADQMSRVQAQLATLDEAAFAARRCTTFSGQEAALAHALFEHTLKFAVAYKMQLFLQAKAAGAELGSSNLWAGKDPAPKN